MDDLSAGGFPPDTSVEELRDAPRFSVIIRSAKLVCEGGEYLCVVRDISATGCRLRLFREPPPDKHLVAGASISPATLRDLSQRGGRIDADCHLAMDQQVRLEIDGLRAVYAKVRWRHQASYGLVFDNTFRLDELAQLAFRLQPPASDHSAGDAGEEKTNYG